MATKAYLTQEDFETGKQLFLTGRFATLEERRLACSAWLADKLEHRLSNLEGWAEAKPILLGSWARRELCPKSDVDLLLVGDERAAAILVGEAQSLGIKIRSRMPEDHADWSIGVEPFDVLALFSARALAPDVTLALEAQKKQLGSRAGLRRGILSAIRKERAARKKRHDSISNYLEPQLKFGAGGLRDLEQARMVKTLLPAIFSRHDEEAFKKIIEAKDFLLGLRQMVHWLGGSEVLAAGFQLELARHLGFTNLSEMMKELQIRLERGSFYADWVVEQSLHRKNAKRQADSVLTPTKAVQLLKQDPSLSNQYRVRRQARSAWRELDDVAQGRFMQNLLGKARPDEFWTALTRSLLLEECLPDLKKVKGLTQHDHYHRFTVETHLYQTLRETDRLEAHPKQLFSLAVAAKDLKAADWAILRWTALFHDLGKGREEDHSTVGAELVRTRLKKMNIAEGIIEEVAWLVQNHLILTTAAFRQNANHPSTWKRLFDRGVSGIRLNQLMVFSAIDIRATNPEAWNSWKARLLSELFLKLRSPAALSHQKFLGELAAKKTKIAPEVLSELDAFLIESLPRQVLVEDLKNLAKASDDLPITVRKRSRNQLWVRFHRKLDRPGLFLEFVQKLFWTSARIDAASVMTLQHYGAYDWFLVRTTRTPRELLNRLSQGSENWRVEVPKVTFQSVDVVSDDQQQWILSFRGKDQKGLLLAAAQAIYDLGLAIHWARVHTWGSQIDDVFCVEAKGDLQNHLRILRERFVT